ncbi:uncharacterized protein LOC144106798 [Amblyomma americanum]
MTQQWLSSGVDLHVIIKGRLICERHGTEVAAEQFFAHVDVEVFHQVAPLSEAPAAVAAAVRPLAGVGPVVVFQIAMVHRGVAAQRALQQPRSGSTTIVSGWLDVPLTGGNEACTRGDRTFVLKSEPQATRS